MYCSAYGTQRLFSLVESALGNFTTVVMLVTFFSDLLLLPFLAGVVVLLITCTESWSATSRLLLPLSARWLFDRGCWFEAEEPPLFRGWLFTVLSRLFCICSISKAALLSTLCFSEYLIFVCVQETRAWQKINMYFKETNLCKLWIQLAAVCWLSSMPLGNSVCRSTDTLRKEKCFKNWSYQQMFLQQIMLLNYYF